jgi:hypothetical protein
MSKMELLASNYQGTQACNFRNGIVMFSCVVDIPLPYLNGPEHQKGLEATQISASKASHCSPFPEEYVNRNSILSSLICHRRLCKKILSLAAPDVQAMGRGELTPTSAFTMKPETIIQETSIIIDTHSSSVVRLSVPETPESCIQENTVLENGHN